MNQREASRQNYTATNTTEDINSGCLQRIADATEKMALNYDKLISDRDWYKNLYNNREYTRRLEKQNSAYKGVITKLKKKLNS